jgi:CubicO group peptidase (beta-lactamase class C family)
MATTPPDPVFDKRLSTFVAGGWDPLTVPIEWYDSVDVIKGDAREMPSAKSKRIAPDALTKASKWAEAQASTAFVVAQDDRIIAEHYWQGTTAETRFNPQSMAKTLVALLTGIAINMGEIKSVDDPVGRYLVEWKNDPRGKITLRQLLQMASGLAQIDGGKGYALTPDNPAARQYFGSDFDGPMLALAQLVPAGQQFDYNNNNTKLVARVLESVSGRRYAALLSERLWKPLGLTDGSIYVDRPGGSAMVSCCVFSRPRDWVAIGRLIAGRGRLDGKQIVSSEWITRMIEPSSTYKGYGMQIWVGNQQVGGAPLPPVLIPWQSETFAAADIVILNGFGGQRVWIMPSANLIIVRAGKSWPKAWDDAVIPNLLWRATKR